MRRPPILTRIAIKTDEALLQRRDLLRYGRLYRPPRLTRILRPRQLLLAGTRLPGGPVEIRRHLPPAAVEDALAAADRLCDHLFDLLGSGPRRVSEPAPHGGYAPIPWQADPRSGFSWDAAAPACRIPLVPAPGPDVKGPWELSRFQHLPLLGKAFFLTGKRKYRDEIRFQIEDWIDHNRLGYGVNWTSAMEAALRAVSWLVATEFLPPEHMPEPFLARLQSSLIEHGLFIRSHLERYGDLSNNHYIADLVGLLFIALYYPELPASGRWERFARAELLGETARQIHPDGCHFEGSTAYHAFVLEMFLYAEILAARAGRPMPDALRAALRRMCAAAVACAKPDGRLPQIGDNDSALFLNLGPRRAPGVAHLLPIAAAHCGEPSIAPVGAPPVAEDALWVLGSDASAAAAPPAATIPLPTAGGAAFPDAGWYVIRAPAGYALVSCGALGRRGYGGHNHNDLLSFVLCLDGQDVIVDPGTFCYGADPEQRDRFRSTQAHNTIQVGGREQNRIEPGHTFRLFPASRIRRALLDPTPAAVRFEGTIDYSGVRHTRRLAAESAPTRWRVEDTVACDRPAEAVIRFHLAPGLDGDANAIRDRAGRVRARLEPTGYRLAAEPYEYSPEYGVKVPALRLVGRFAVGSHPVDVALTIIPQA